MEDQNKGIILDRFAISFSAFDLYRFGCIKNKIEDYFTISRRPEYSILSKDEIKRYLVQISGIRKTLVDFLNILLWQTK